jgi:hypothetical protein
MGKVVPKYMLRAKDFKKINSYLEIKRDKYVFITDKYTMNKTPDKMKELIRNYEKWVIKIFNYDIVIHQIKSGRSI